MNKQIIILAAGHGTRMKSNLPKVMHDVDGKPMIEHVITNCYKASDDLVLVHSHHLQPYLDQFTDRCKLANQKEQLGTAHAVAAAKDLFANEKYIGVIYGDNPLITDEIINDLFTHLEQTGSKAVTLAFEYAKPNQYGRIVTDAEGNFERIVETKFANEEERKITLCNSGIMAFAPGILEEYIDKCLAPNPEHPEREFYLTEIIEICSLAGEKVSYFKSGNPNLVVGVNTQDELVNANSIIQNHKEG